MLLGAAIATLGLAVALPSLAPSHGAVAGPLAAPKIRVAEDLTHDFGTIPSDELVEHSWTFTNGGDDTLRILSVRSSCGCTIDEMETRELPPGGESTIDVTFDPSGQEGKVRRTLTVSTNDPVLPRFRLVLKADVQVADSHRLGEGHPPVAGQSLLMGDCASCHSEPAANKTGEALWIAVCAMCHGPRGEGARAPGIRHAGYLDSRSDEELHARIAYGTSNPRMPGYSRIMGGPLDDEQIGSLVSLIRQWGPVSGRSDAATAEPPE